MIKTPQTRKKGELPQLNQKHIQKKQKQKNPTASIILSDEKPEHYHCAQEQGKHVPSTTAFQYCTQSAS